MWKSIEAFCTDESGATAIEYAFIAGLVSIVSVVSWTAMGDTLNTGYTSISDAMTNAVSGSGSERTVVEATKVVADKSGSLTLR
ncbi:MAG: Flp family type IVb pilin [Alphaproteobacteria bacterium]|nr:Flp family type IVb pilin [Alphaproteobacteria bacterium]